VRPARGDDRPKIKAIYDADAKRGTGRLDRPEALWDHALLDERVHTLVLERDDDLVGYVSFEHEQTEPHASVRIRVRDVAARDDEATRALLGVLGAQGDQATSVEIDLAADDPFSSALGEIDAHRSGTADLEHSFGVLAGGPMVRLHDTERALMARGWRHDGEATFVVEGAPITVSVREGRAQVRRSNEDGVRLDKATLGAIAFGSLTAQDAERIGLASGDPAKIQAADHLLTSPSFFTRDHF
jgi:predicted acetyltransferase